MDCSTVVAVVVTFNPDLCALTRQLDSLQSQVALTVVVDNQSLNQKQLWQLLGTRSGLEWMPQPNNEGLGVAQNLGIQRAMTWGAKYVLLMDQDSEPASDMVLLLLCALAGLPSTSVVGPAYSDRRRHRVSAPFYKRNGFVLSRIACTDANAVVAVDHLISSGCLIPAEVFQLVGLLREDFFIDFVDIEWCLRAQRANVGLFGVCAASMSHDLGDAPFVLLGREFPVHSPKRHYFHVRNGVYLYRQSWVGLPWKVASVWRLLLKIGFHVVCVRPRIEHLKWSCWGLLDGLCGRMGRGR